jgi:hypothetical protein
MQERLTSEVTRLRRSTVDLTLVAGGVGTLVTLSAEVVRKEQFVVACPLGAVDATDNGGHKLRVPFVEWRILEKEQDVGINPELQIADGKEDTRRFVVVCGVVDLLEAGPQREGLLLRWKLRHQKSMADADVVLIYDDRTDTCTKAPEALLPTQRDICLLISIAGWKVDHEG